MRATTITIAFACSVFFTDAMTSAHMKSLIGRISFIIFIPQSFGLALIFTYLSRSMPLYLKFSLGVVPVFCISLLEARFFLGFANLVGKLPYISWMGRKNKIKDNE